MDYVKIKFKGGWALLAASEFDAKKYELYTEPEPAPVGQEKEPPVEVKKNVADSRGRNRKK